MQITRPSAELQVRPPVLEGGDSKGPPGRIRLNLCLSKRARVLAVRSSHSALHPYLRGAKPGGQDAGGDQAPGQKKSQEGKAHLSVPSLHLQQTQGKGGAEASQESKARVLTITWVLMLEL